jgi:hypothetical protein
VRFHPQDETSKHGRSLTCVTGARGEFVGRCLPGRYKVTLAAVPTNNARLAAEQGAVAAAGRLPPSVSERYTTPAATPWTVTIPDDGKKDVVLKVE